MDTLCPSSVVGLVLGCSKPTLVKVAALAMRWPGKRAPFRHLKDRRHSVCHEWGLRYPRYVATFPYRACRRSPYGQQSVQLHLLLLLRRQSWQAIYAGRLFGAKSLRSFPASGAGEGAARGGCKKCMELSILELSRNFIPRAAVRKVAAVRLEQV